MGCPGKGGKLLPFRCHLRRRYQPTIAVSFCLELMTWSNLTFRASLFRMGQHPLNTGVFLLFPANRGLGNSGSKTELALLNSPGGMKFNWPPDMKGSRMVALALATRPVPPGSTAPAVTLRVVVGS